MLRCSMHLEGCLVRIDFDQQEDAWIATFLMEIEAMTTRFARDACRRMSGEAGAKGLDSVLSHLQMSGVQHRHHRLTN